jgi:two-component system NtrC family response regulator
MKKTCKASNKQVSKEAMDLLLKYNYPGNVRELENIVQRACVLSRGDTITSYDLPNELKDPRSENGTGNYSPFFGDLNEQLNNLEREIIRIALRETQGNLAKAARVLNISERNLRYKIEKQEQLIK